jgi:hypothetical protein
VLVVGPGARDELAANKTVITDWLKSGGHLLAIGIAQQDADGFLPSHVGFKKREHISTYFQASGKGSPFAGIASADLHNRDPREFSLVTSGATPIGDGALAASDDGRIVFCQIAPWRFDSTKQMNLKRTYRRVSFVLTRLLSNLHAASSTPIAARFDAPPAAYEKRWLTGLYLDQPEEWDDPYRFFRW